MGDSGIPLQCIPLDFTLQDGGSFTKNECVQPCDVTNDCIDSITSCQFNICYFNFCPTNALPYSACNSAATNDGQCFPEPIGHGEAINVCFQTGVSSTLSTCSGERNSTASLCSFDNMCLNPYVDAGDYCFEACDIAGILPCDAGECLGLGEPGINTGICVTPCNSVTPCPETQVCTSNGFCAPKTMAVE
jgi:hypothetical protein